MSKINSQGFTLIELLVVITIMVTLTSLFLVNFSSQGKARSLSIAKNNAVSDLRKMQSYALTSRDIAPGTVSGFYGISFSTNSPAFYTLLGYDNKNSPANTIATVYTPTNAVLSGIRVIRSDGTIVNPTYIEILFKTTYARTVASYSGNGALANKESDDTIRLTFTNVANNTLTTTIDINGITGNINQ
ncbi:MAG: hypothetical protein JWO40_282 [Candidatus Doudnabacteria bacterium]|nr:hypothetical protein [Candidatus Doudnabacteria bacterium]